MKAIDRPHFFAIEKIKKQIEKNKSTGSVKKIYLVDLEERHEITPDLASSFAHYHDVYGIWFAGSIGAAIYRRCGHLHAFVSFKPENLEEGGPFNLTSYGVDCLLYVWKAQGFIRGMILAAEDSPEVHATAKALMAEKPWVFEPIFATVATVVPITLAPQFTKSLRESPNSSLGVMSND